MTPNEWRATLNMAPIEGGDKPIRRLDTQVVDLIENMLNKMNSENCTIMSKMIIHLIDSVGRSREDETQNTYPGCNDTE